MSRTLQDGAGVGSPGHGGGAGHEKAPNFRWDCDPDDACCPDCGSPLERRGCWEPYGEGHVRRTWLECPRCDPVY